MRTAARVRIVSPTVPTRALWIFDLDGTLYRTASSFLPTMRRVFEEFGVPSPGDDAILSMVGETYSRFLEWLAPQGFPDDLACLGERISELEFASIRTHGELFEGVEAGLRELRDGGGAIALCTNGDRRYADFVLSTHGIAASFDTLATNDDDRRSKTEMVRGLLGQFRPTVAVVVGDRYHDVEAGNANGCITVGAAYGYARPGELDGATHVIDRFHDLLTIAERIGALSR